MKKNDYVSKKYSIIKVEIKNEISCNNHQYYNGQVIYLTFY